MKKIALIPIDNRPVCYCLPKQIAACMDNYELLMPERGLLGSLTTPAKIRKLMEWLEGLKEVDYIVLSLDTLAYGGLVNSRRSSEVYDDVIARLEELKDILKKKSAKVFGFSSIMRISNNNINEEEKEYWGEYGKKIFDYSYNLHRSKKLNDNESHSKQSCISETIPKEILDDYLTTRERNLMVNEHYFSWLEEGVLDFIVYSKDDCAQYGLNVWEAEILQDKIFKNKYNAIIKTGADEIPLSLISRVLTQNNKIKILPVFTQPDYTNKISKYEDISVLLSTISQIDLSGAKVAKNRDDADLILLINNFKNEQGEIVMGVSEECFAGDFKLPEKPYFIADILNANGADNCFVDNLFKKGISIENFYGYAGWNTTGNTLGSAICAALAKFCAENANLNLFKKVIMTRFLDDWAYQANVRQALKAENADFSSKTIKAKMQPYEEKLNNILSTNYSKIEYVYPWNRFFEVEISIGNE